MPDAVAYDDLANPDTVHEAEQLAALLGSNIDDYTERDEHAALIALVKLFDELADSMNADSSELFEQLLDFVNSGDLDDIQERDPARHRAVVITLNQHVN